jgi:hypothetical protein
VPETATVQQLARDNGHAVPQGGTEAAKKYAAQLAEGEVPSLRQVQREMHVTRHAPRVAPSGRVML